MSSSSDSENDWIAWRYVSTQFFGPSSSSQPPPHKRKEMMLTMKGESYTSKKPNIKIESKKKPREKNYVSNIRQKEQKTKLALAGRKSLNRHWEKRYKGATYGTLERISEKTVISDSEDAAVSKDFGSPERLRDAEYCFKQTGQDSPLVRFRKEQDLPLDEDFNETVMPLAVSNASLLSTQNLVSSQDEEDHQLAERKNVVEMHPVSARRSKDVSNKEKLTYCVLPTQRQVPESNILSASVGKRSLKKPKSSGKSPELVQSLVKHRKTGNIKKNHQSKTPKDFESPERLRDGAYCFEQTGRHSSLVRFRKEQDLPLDEDFNETVMPLAVSNASLLSTQNLAGSQDEEDHQLAGRKNVVEMHPVSARRSKDVSNKEKLSYCVLPTQRQVPESNILSASVGKRSLKKPKSCGKSPELVQSLVKHRKTGNIKKNHQSKTPKDFESPERLRDGAYCFEQTGWHSSLVRFRKEQDLPLDEELNETAVPLAVHLRKDVVEMHPVSARRSKDVLNKEKCTHCVLPFQTQVPQSNILSVSVGIRSLKKPESFEKSPELVRPLMKDRKTQNTKKNEQSKTGKSSRERKRKPNSAGLDVVRGWWQQPTDDPNDPYKISSMLADEMERDPRTGSKITYTEFRRRNNKKNKNIKSDIRGRIMSFSDFSNEVIFETSEDESIEENLGSAQRIVSKRQRFEIQDTNVRSSDTE